MDDHSIIKLLWDRAETAIEALARRFGQRLLLTARNILGDHQDAEETVNDTYLAVWDTIPPQRPDPLAAFVYKIGRNLALKRYRHNTAAKRDGTYDVSLEELAGCIPGKALEETVEARELGRAIDTFLDGLKKADRDLFLRRYWFGDDVKSLAKAFGLSQNAATVRLSRIRAKLRDFLIKEGYYE